jgi:hypothetical protein
MSTVVPVAFWIDPAVALTVPDVLSSRAPLVALFDELSVSNASVVPVTFETCSAGPPVVLTALSVPAWSSVTVPGLVSESAAAAPEVERVTSLPAPSPEVDRAGRVGDVDAARRRGGDVDVVERRRPHRHRSTARAVDVQARTTRAGDRDLARRSEHRAHRVGRRRRVVQPHPGRLVVDDQVRDVERAGRRVELQARLRARRRVGVDDVHVVDRAATGVARATRDAARPVRIELEPADLVAVVEADDVSGRRGQLRALPRSGVEQRHAVQRAAAVRVDRQALVLADQPLTGVEREPVVLPKWPV